MKSIVIYKSKTGFVKKYAQWIAEELGADLIPHSKAKVDVLINYDTIIYGGGLYAVGINGIKLITNNLNKLKDKKIVVFASGATPAREEVLEEIKNKNFSKEQQQFIEFFYMRGGFDYSKLNFIDKILMTLMKRMLIKKENPTADERGLLNAYETPVDFTRQQNTKDLITYVKS